MSLIESLAVLVGLIVGVIVLLYAFAWGDTTFPVAGDMRPKAPTRVSTKPPKDEFLDVYSMVGCPSCGQPHRYGLDREYLDCYACNKTFSPRFEGRKYESYKKETR